MSAEITWEDTEKTTLVVWYAHPPDVDDVLETSDIASGFLDSVDHPVSVIVDLQVGLSMPRNWMAYRPLFVGSKGINHPNLALNVFVISEDNTPLHLTVGIIAKPQIGYAIAYSMDEAHEIVATFQENLAAVRTV